MPRVNHATPYEVENLRFASNSIALAEVEREVLPPDLSLRVTTKDEPQATDLAIQKLMQSDRGALGFIPSGGPEGLRYLVERERIVIAEANGEVIGYTAFTVRDFPESGGGTIKLQQVCVRDDARLLGLGRKMVTTALNRVPEHYQASCNVRVDLPANEFWESIGFRLAHQFRHKTSGSTLNHYELPNEENTNG
jgi:ribosomal protein S18 acetylase RimI-like enzyme